MQVAACLILIARRNIGADRNLNPGRGNDRRNRHLLPLPSGRQMEGPGLDDPGLNEEFEPA